ncbi:MAG: PH domain-containing protein [Pyrinomonadaceae bacterium]|nr:PH domain-containing protein [Pyrinomonadaceae bacterium]
MYCMKCGAKLNTEAQFCTVCGTPTDSDETRVATAATRPTPAALSGLPERNNVQAREGAADDEEQVVFTARPTLLFINLGYVIAALSALLVVFILGLVSDVPAFVSVPLALSLLLIPAFYHLRRNSIRYTLTDTKIEIARGLVSQTTRNIPLRNIQDVTVSASLWQRLLGFGDLLIDNASDNLGATALHNLPDPRRHADLLLRELRRWR